MTIRSRTLAESLLLIVPVAAVGLVLIVGSSEMGSGPGEGPVPQQTTPPRVIVVGAGLSGLSTALELADGGASVVVIDMSSV
ncbi:MAG TPA: hypothetical protein DCE43_02615, partial [Planctomycetaceae bacterium]|nr:hypothetical protein [Planctomycetaceae bacterium]